MAATAYVNEMKTKHAKLDAEIKQAMKSPQPDTLLIQHLKKQKLQLKDQIKASA